MGEADMYKIAICDDDVDDIEELKELILKCNDEKYPIQFWEFHSGKELLGTLFDELDVIFVDIQMDGMDGNQTSVNLRTMGYRGILVHCSGVFMPTPDTIKISPYRYLLKHCSTAQRIKELDEILEEMAARKVCYEIEGSYRREKMMFRVEDIVYISHHKNGSSVLHLNQNKAKRYNDGNVIVPYGFEALMQMLETADFACPHNSYLLNLRYISSISLKKGVLVADGTILPISRSKKKQFARTLAEYSNKKYR